MQSSDLLPSRVAAAKSKLFMSISTHIYRADFSIITTLKVWEWVTIQDVNPISVPPSWPQNSLPNLPLHKRSSCPLQNLIYLIQLAHETSPQQRHFHWINASSHLISIPTRRVDLMKLHCWVMGLSNIKLAVTRFVKRIVKALLLGLPPPFHSTLAQMTLASFPSWMVPMRMRHHHHPTNSNNDNNTQASTATGGKSGSSGKSGATSNSVSTILTGVLVPLLFAFYN